MVETKIVDGQEVGRYMDAEKRAHQIENGYLSISLPAIVSKKDRERGPEYWAELKRQLLECVKDSFSDAFDDELLFRGW